MLKMRTLVVNMIYDDEKVDDPAFWAGSELDGVEPTNAHYGVLSIMATTGKPLSLPLITRRLWWAPVLSGDAEHTVADYRRIGVLRTVCVMPTDEIRDIRGDRV